MQNFCKIFANFLICKFYKFSKMFDLLLPFWLQIVVKVCANNLQTRLQKICKIFLQTCKFTNFANFQKSLIYFYHFDCKILWKCVRRICNLGCKKIAKFLQTCEFANFANFQKSLIYFYHFDCKLSWKWVQIICKLGCIKFAKFLQICKFSKMLELLLPIILQIDIEVHANNI